MTFLNAQQLAFILDIKKEDARAKMCNAWEKEKGIPMDKDGDGPKLRGAKRKKNKIEDEYPQSMSIKILSAHLNLPHLQSVVDDITSNYLTRKATKKYILYDYPEKKLKAAEADGKGYPVRIDLNPALKSLLPKEVTEEIYRNWLGSFQYTDKEGEVKPKICLR